jgi:[protein-PII] uridylyltransferase
VSGARTLSEIRAPRPVNIENGAAAARARAEAVDRCLIDLIDEQLGPRIAVAAVGGYGRGELSPHSDIDVLFLVPRGATPPPASFRGVLYPLWDAGWQVGHATRSPKETIAHAREDLHFATALLSARFIAGDEQLWADLDERRKAWLHREPRRLVRRILDSTATRHRAQERAGWALAPDLKDGIGGLRDLHTVTWIEAATGATADKALLTDAGDCLLAVREALHAELKRPGDTLRIDLQPAVAQRLGYTNTDADSVMSTVHSSARIIEHRAGLVLQAVTKKVVGGPRRSGAVMALRAGISLADNRLVVDRQSPNDALSTVLDLVASVADTGKPIEPRWLQWAEATVSSATPRQWTDAQRVAFFEVLAGEHAAAALELLDHVGAWPSLMPEWLHVRGRAQHDPYHRYTVDGHSFVTVAELNKVLQEDRALHSALDGDSLAELRLAALLHDIGKGSGSDHSVAGEQLATAICRRIGIDEPAAETVAFLVRRHLLLPDTATRRDLDDGAVISDVADCAGTARRLHFLYALAAADGRATGPGAWTEWKAALVSELYRKALVALETGLVPARTDATIRAREIESFEPSLAGRVEPILSTLPPSYLESIGVPEMADEIRLMLTPPDPGEVRMRVEAGAPDEPSLLTLCTLDRPGILAKAAGVLAFNRIRVLRAQAYSTSRGVAIERFVVIPPVHARWEGLGRQIEACLAGRAALDPLLAGKVRDYHPGGPMTCDVRVLEDASPHSSVIEVRTKDALGILYAVAAGITDLDLDIHVAKIDTMGERVVDVFYVRTAWGSKLDQAQAAALEQSIRHRIELLFGSEPR